MEALWWLRKETSPLQECILTSSWHNRLQDKPMDFPCNKTYSSITNLQPTKIHIQKQHTIYTCSFSTNLGVSARRLFWHYKRGLFKQQKWTHHTLHNVPGRHHISYVNFCCEQWKPISVLQDISKLSALWEIPFQSYDWDINAKIEAIHIEWRTHSAANSF